MVTQEAITTLKDDIKNGRGVPGKLIVHAELSICPVQFVLTDLDNVYNICT